MVWNRRHVMFLGSKKFDRDKVAPYCLHVLMVLAVAAYVFVGAVTIRAIEATPKAPDDTAGMTKSEKYWFARQQQQQHVKRNGSDHDHATEHGRIERGARRVEKMHRSRKCVIAALRHMATASKCHSAALTPDVMAQLDRCYAEDLRRLIRRSHTNAVSRGVPTTSTAPNEVQWEYWSMTDAVLFCFTVITTIGYGNVAPQTFSGQVFVIVYGLFGVPFSMLVIANLGKFLAQMLRTWTRPFSVLARRCYRRCCVRRGIRPKDQEALMKGPSVVADHRKRVAFDTGSEEGTEDEGEDASGQDAGSLFVAFVLYLVVGSVIISSYEPEMDVFKAIYYTFVSLTTIGLGDVVPKSESYLLFTLIYIAVGLALTTIAIEIASDYLKKLHYFGRKMENVGNVQIWFGGKKLSMKQLVKNLGDQFNLPVDDLQELNLDAFVDNAIKVEEGVLPTLRTHDYPYGIKPIFITDFKDPYRDGSVIYMDEDERYFVYNRSRGAYERVPPMALPAPECPAIDANGNDV